MHVYRYDDSGNMVRDGTYAYRYDPENRLVKVQKSGPYGTLTLGDAMESPLTYTTGGNGSWTAANGGEGHEDMSAASSPSLAQGQQSWLQTEVQGPGTFSFWAKLDPYYASNALEFYVDGTLRYSCDSADWEQFSWAVTGAGTHTLKWVCRRNSATYSSTGYVDNVGWTGSLPALPPLEPAVTNWRYLEYTYDASGRRIEKKYDYETITKYVYDGDHCIAEYNAYNQLKRKYIYGPCTDEPICLIDTMTSPAVTSYYHFDALGSVVALTNASGNTVEVYEYDVYGRVGATDANHPNRIMFTGREYDKETGLYYYRARHYNPQIGRFLQADPVGYRAGMNLYRYCSNQPVNRTDPYGWDDKPYRLCIFIGNYYDKNLSQSLNDWDDCKYVTDMTDALIEIEAANKNHPGCELTIQSSFSSPDDKPSNDSLWNLGGDKSPLKKSLDNPLVKILRTTNASKINWRCGYIRQGTGTIDDLQELIAYAYSPASGTPPVVNRAVNSLILDNGYGKTISERYVVVNDKGAARGYERPNMPAGAPGADPDYDIYGTVISFTPQPNGTIKAANPGEEGYWTWNDDHTDTVGPNGEPTETPTADAAKNNAKQPY